MKIAHHPPAKINLFFEVLRRRDDGFHGIVSVASLISLCDTLTVQPKKSSGIVLTIDGETPDFPAIPSDERNLVVKTLRLLQRECGTNNGAEVMLFKRIPSQSGLGGGSSDAASALLLANVAWNLNLTETSQLELAAKIGSDVPLFVRSHLDKSCGTISSGRGEITVSIDGFDELNFVLIKPNEGLETAAVYRDCMKYHDGKLRNIEPLLEAMRNKDIDKIGDVCFNRLEVPSGKLWNKLETYKETLIKAGCLNAIMTGSGTAIYGICKNKEQAKHIAQQLKTNNTFQVWNVTTALSPDVFKIDEN
ncbi:MAG: 4-(cytidine 5'-diphospho)-2-C-methyl-D-erythritol kinase [Planctomycetaceae bacterium]|jgi:4-diphosphocytidyl-2-C-methyl-D-erythritol kinase|nr:4-(cytidine 5'-diphospho)-2-C-methyl-D-erythritol kinase [Planctomycetaceae bacterium]